MTSQSIFKSTGPHTYFLTRKPPPSQKSSIERHDSQRILNQQESVCVCVPFIHTRSDGKTPSLTKSFTIQRDFLRELMKISYNDKASRGIGEMTKKRVRRRRLISAARAKLRINQI